jgi:predicted ester cyclase
MSHGKILQMYAAYLAACNDRAWETIADFVHSAVGHGGQRATPPMKPYRGFKSAPLSSFTS